MSIFSTHSEFAHSESLLDILKRNKNIYALEFEGKTIDEYVKSKGGNVCDPKKGCEKGKNEPSHTFEIAGLLKVENGNVVGLLAHKPLKYDEKAPAVARIPDDIRSKYGFHTHFPHNERSFNPPTRADVRVFLIFALYHRVMNWENARESELVITNWGVYVIEDGGALDLLLDEYNRLGGYSLYPLDVCTKLVDEHLDDETFIKNLYTACRCSRHNLEHGGGISSPDVAKNNAEVWFFHCEECKNAYLESYARFKVKISATSRAEVS